jgi:DNA polymerase-3 subunit delta'
VSLPASFEDFLGNRATVNQLRAAIAAGRLPHSLILAGPQGAGKYTLALMLTLALQCERQPREPGPEGQPLAGFCGQCRHCTRILESGELDTLVASAVETREEMREVDKKDTRILIQTHPDVLILPPDPPQMLIKIGQVRSLIQSSNYRPAEAPRKVFLFTAASFMKEAANSLLKVLEEPPGFVHIFLLAENPSELLPTIRSRCALARLGTLPPGELEALLAQRRPELRPQQRSLIARLSEGAAGRALGFNFERYGAARIDALVMLRNAAVDPDHTALFKMTESYRAGAEGQAKTNAFLRAMGSLLEDILLLQAGTPELARNVDIRPELEKMAAVFDFAWVERASRGLDQVQSGMRRNLLRSLSLDAFAAELSSPRR